MISARRREKSRASDSDSDASGLSDIDDDGFDAAYRERRLQMMQAECVPRPLRQRLTCVDMLPLKRCATTTTAA